MTCPTCGEPCAARREGVRITPFCLACEQREVRAEVRAFAETTPEFHYRHRVRIVRPKLASKAIVRAERDRRRAIYLRLSALQTGTWRRLCLTLSSAALAERYSVPEAIIHLVTRDKGITLTRDIRIGLHRREGRTVPSERARSAQMKVAA